MVRTGKKQTVEGGAKQRSSSSCVTNNNPNPANDQSLQLLSSGYNAHVQKQHGSPLCMRHPRQWEPLRYINNKQPIQSTVREAFCI